MNTYTLFWLSGRAEVITGKTIANAIINAGYRSARALDFYEYGDARSKWDWDKTEHRWYPNRTA